MFIKKNWLILIIYKLQISKKKYKLQITILDQEKR